MEPYEFIQNFEAVLTHFGVWPSFHDGEVHRVVLDRASRSSPDVYGPTTEIQLRGWIMRKGLAKEGLYEKQFDAVVHFLFEDIFDVELEGFSHQNVVSSLNLSMIADQRTGTEVLRVELEHCYLFSCEFTARRARVLKVVPCCDGQ